jgi:hypothetical protein
MPQRSKGAVVVAFNAEINLLEAALLGLSGCFSKDLPCCRTVTVLPQCCMVN